jgi:ribA/ribD-fused uncharacterized protein
MKTDQFAFFYGGALSQWAPSPFTLDGVEYSTAEQYMMAMKADYFNDQDAKAKIMATDSPSEQKSLGRMVKNFNAEAWNAVSRGFVYKANIAKFTQNDWCMKELERTGDLEIVEASPYDRIWGIGLGAHDKRSLDKTQWLGTNWLGETLMKVRKDLREQDSRV